MRIKMTPARIVAAEAMRQADAFSFRNTTDMTSAKRMLDSRSAAIQPIGACVIAQMMIQ
jgi:hypothetical protein